MNKMGIWGIAIAGAFVIGKMIVNEIF